MTGVAGLKCPECGTEHRNERRLYRTRRHRFAVLVACVLLVFASGVRPRRPVSSGRMDRACSIMGCHCVDSSLHAAGAVPFKMPMSRTYVPGSVSSRVVTTLLARRSLGELSLWERRWLVNRAIAAAEDAARPGDLQELNGAGALLDLRGPREPSALTIEQQTRLDKIAFSSPSTHLLCLACGRPRLRTTGSDASPRMDAPATTTFRL